MNKHNDYNRLHDEVMRTLSKSSIINSTDHEAYTKYIVNNVMTDQRLPTQVFSRSDLVDLIPKDRNNYARKYWKYAYTILPVLEYVYLTTYR